MRCSGIGWRAETQAVHQVGEGHPPEMGQRLKRRTALGVTLLALIRELDELGQFLRRDRFRLALGDQLVKALLRLRGATLMIWSSNAVSAWLRCGSWRWARSASSSLTNAANS